MSKSDGVYIDLQSFSTAFSRIIYAGTIFSWLAAYFINTWFYVLMAIFSGLLFFDIHFRYIQTKHGVLRNFGMFGGIRYLMESIGPELRQYWIASDVEEKPFSRRERGEVYRYAKNTGKTAAFGTLETQQYGMIRHSVFPRSPEELEHFALTFGEERGCRNPVTITKPFYISGMSFGALGDRAVRALARGAHRAGILMNTGEGGYPKYHLMEEADIIFQMGTAKFGVRKSDSSLDDQKLSALSELPQIKMIEIKFSQGAKPGKGGMLPASKVSEEIAQLRGVPFGQNCYSPVKHIECDNPANTVKFIRRVQEISQLPVGVKFCIGRVDQFYTLIQEMKHQDSFPDYIVIDGAEGGTGAAPRSFMDYVGIPLFRALALVRKIFQEERVRSKFKLIASGKLINPARQITAFSYGADAVATARGFMLALGCIQALQCNNDTCPVGITTHNKHLQRGLDVEAKSVRVMHYANNLDTAIMEILAATGCTSLGDLRNQDVMFNPWEHK